MDINSWVPTLIYRNVLTQFTELNDYFIHKAKEIREKNPNPTTCWDCDTYNTQELYDFLNDEKLKEFISVCESEVNKFSQHFGVSLPAKCVDAWINVSSPGDYQEYHIHPLRHFSLVCCVLPAYTSLSKPTLVRFYAPQTVSLHLLSYRCNIFPFHMQSRKAVPFGCDCCQ